MRLQTVKTPSGTTAVVEEKGLRRIIRDKNGNTFLDLKELFRTGTEWQELAQRARDEVSPSCSVVRPILAPGAIVCVGLNYRKHILEMGRELPKVPTLFSKLSRSLTNPEAPILLPAQSAMVDYEGELTIVIGKGGRNITKERALDAVAGFTLMNDVTMRDFQKRSLQWFAGKSWENSTPIGPTIVTPEELTDFSHREIITRVNGVERQRAPMSDLVFDVPSLIADLSNVITLEPGDIIATGTPGGVGDAMKPASYLKPNDIVEIEMMGIGILRNRFEGGL